MKSGNVGFSLVHGIGMPRLDGSQFVSKRALNAASGDVDVAAPPSGKRWLILGGWVINSGTGGAISFTLQFKNSGTYYKTQVAVSVGNNAVSTIQHTQMPILESTDTLSVNTTGAGLNFFFLILEFSTSSPMRSAKVLSLANGDNTLYTCPAGKSATTFSFVSSSSVGSGMLNFQNANVVYRNDSGGARNAYANNVLSGGSPAAPAAGSNALSFAASSVANATTASLAGTGMLNAGDFINVNTDAGTATQAAWCNIIEL